jgi:flagellar basal-body rod modification protein FlgD
MSAIGSVSTANPPSATSGYGDLSSDEFLQIMFAELTNQDPLSPSETKDLLQQVGTIRSIESDLALSDRLEAIVQQNELASAGAFIGKYVIGRTQFNDHAEDFVGSVTVTESGPVLNLLNGYSVPIDRVDEIVDPSIASALLGSASAS